MIYTKYLLLIITFKDFILIKLVLIGILLLVLKYLYKLIIKNPLPDGYEPFTIFKVENRRINTFWVICYFIFFVIGICYLRFYRYNYNIDLKPSINIIRFFIIQKDYLLLMIIFLLILSLILSFIIIIRFIKLFLELRLLRQHIILSYPKKDYFAWTINQYDRPLYESPYSEFLYWHYNYFGYHTIISLISLIQIKILKCCKKIYISSGKTHIVGNYLDNMQKIILIILKPQYNVLIIIILLMNDCYYNDFVIEKIFKLLPFYFLYTLWYKFSVFQYTAFPLTTLSKITYELYYCENSIIYSNLDEKDLTLIYLYIRSGLCGDYLIDKHDALGHSFRIQHYCKYVKVKGHFNIFYCEGTKDYKQLYINKND